MYANLVYATPGLTTQDIPKYFKDSSFGVQPNQAESTYWPRSDVTIVRDKAYGVPHVYGATRAGAMFGLGYAGAEDRLFFMDVLRHAGRGELAGFAGLTDHHIGLPVELRLDRASLLLELKVAGLELDALALEPLLVALGCPKGLAAREQEVAGKAVLHPHCLAHLPELGDAFQQNDFHV